MVGVNPEVAHEHMAGLNFFHAVAQALEAGKLFHIDLNDQKPGRFDQDLRFGSESIKPLFFLVKLLEESGYDGPRHFDAHAYRTEDYEGVWEFARGCMRTYLILKDKAQQFAEDRGDPGAARRDSRTGRGIPHLQPRGVRSAQGAHLRSRRPGLAAAPLRAAGSAAGRPAARRALMAGRAGRQYLGLDASTQSLSAVVIEVAGDGPAKVVLESSLNFDEALPHYGTRHGVLPRTDPAIRDLFAGDVGRGARSAVAESRRQRSGPRADLAAISGSAQQHGSVYLNAARRQRAARGSIAARPLSNSWRRCSREPSSPIWMDCSTSAECAEITRAVGGDAALAQRTGSRAFERFTGPQIRKFADRDPGGYARDRSHPSGQLVHGVAAGRRPRAARSGRRLGHEPDGPRERRWWTPALTPPRPDLGAKLPPIAPRGRVVGRSRRTGRRGTVCRPANHRRGPATTRAA